jgi:hypothetical protein
MGEVETLYWGREKGSQVSSARPSDKSSVKVKTLEWLEAVV